MKTVLILLLTTVILIGQTVTPTLVGEVNLGVGMAKVLKVWGNDYIFGKTYNDILSTFGLVSREGVNFWSHSFDSSVHYTNSLVVNNDVIVLTLRDTIYILNKQGTILKRVKVPTAYSGPYSAISIHKGENGHYIAHEGDFGSSVIRWFIYDESLNYLGTKEGIHPGGIRRVIQDQVGNYIVASSQYGGGIYSNVSINFDKYDINGNLIWTTKIPDAGRADIVLVNGRLYFSCLFLRQSDPSMVTRYGELSLSTGDTLWTKQWIAPGFPLGVESLAVPINSLASPDGGFVILGEATRPGQTNPNVPDAFALVVTAEGDISWIIRHSQLGIFNAGDWNEDRELVLVGSGGAGSFSKLSFYNIPGITVGVDDEENGGLPADFTLSQNYPNPFNPETTIRYAVQPTNNLLQQNIKLTIYDIIGREIAVVVNERKSPGSYEVKWNASDLTSGIYFYRLNVGNHSEIKKMLYLR